MKVETLKLQKGQHALTIVTFLQRTTQLTAIQVQTTKAFSSEHISAEAQQSS